MTKATQKNEVEISGFFLTCDIFLETVQVVPKQTLRGKTFCREQTRDAFLEAAWESGMGCFAGVRTRARERMMFGKAVSPTQQAVGDTVWCWFSLSLFAGLL